MTSTGEQTERCGSRSRSAHVVSAWCHSAWKRGLDVCGSALLLTCLLPLMIVVAIGVKLTSPGPVLFRQRRPGKNGSEFDILKFRTICAGATIPAPYLTPPSNPLETYFVPPL